MNQSKQDQSVTLESLARQLERIEQRLEAKDAEQKKTKEWKDLQELGGLFLLGAGLVYVYVTGGFGAIVDWVKSLLLPG